MATSGYALSQNLDGSWGFRAVESDWPLNPGETFYDSIQDFPPEVLAWFAAHPDP